MKLQALRVRSGFSWGLRVVQGPAPFSFCVCGYWQLISDYASHVS